MLIQRCFEVTDIVTKEQDLISAGDEVEAVEIAEDIFEHEVTVKLAPAHLQPYQENGYDF